MVPNAATVQDIWQHTFDDETLARLLECGVGVVEVIGNASDPGPEASPCRLEHTLGPGKRLRLITRHPLSNHDYRQLLLASEPTTMVSGDQSFTDAVSANKAIAIMEPVYSQTYLIDGFLALAEEADMGLAETLRFGTQGLWDRRGYENMQAFVRSGALVSAARRVNAAIQSEHNANSTLVAAVKRRLLTACSAQLADAQRELFEVAWRGFDSRDGLSLPAQQWSRVARLAVDR